MERITVNVDSVYRNKKLYIDSGYFVYRLEEMLKNIGRIRISSVEIPNTFYNISSRRGNNELRIEGNYGDIYPLILMDGKYDNELMREKIQLLLDDVNEASNGYILPYNFKIEIDELTSRVKITNLEGLRNIGGSMVVVGGSNFTLTFPLRGLREVLGYVGSEYSGNNKYVSEKVINLYLDPYIMIRVNDYGNIYNKVRDKRILGKIIVDVNRNEYIFDNRNFVNKEYDFVQPVDIDRLEIELVDRMGERVDLNGCDYSMTLEMDRIESKYEYEERKIGYLRKP